MPKVDYRGAVAVSGQRFIQRLDTERNIHGVRQPPGENMTRRPVHDRHQIQKAALNRDVSDIRAPDLIGTVYPHVPQQIRLNPVFRARIAGSGLLVDRLQAHQPHQASNPVSPDANTFSSQLTNHLARAVKRILQKQLVDATH